jgi:multidrug resistance efflux pump
VRRSDFDMKTKYKIMISAAVIIVLTVASAFSIAAEKLPQYRKIIVTSAKKTNMGQTLKLKGYIEPNAKQEIILDTNQKIDEVLVKEGQMVKAGDLLLRLDESDIAYKLKSEELNLKAVQGELNDLQRTENKDKKSLAFTVTQAEIQYKNAADDFNDAKIRHEGNKTLYSEGFISKEEFDNAERSFTKTEGAMKLQKMQLEQAREALGSFEDNRQSQTDKLRSDIELIKLNMENLNSKIDLNTKALVNGKVIKCKLENGQYPTSDNAEVEIYDLSQYIINTYIKQNEAVQIVKGQKASIVVTGLEQKTYQPG